MDRDTHRISIRQLENGYVVEVPDFAAIKEKQAAAKKANKGPGEPYVYTGDCTKSYAAKTQANVVKLVKTALEQLPGGEYDAAFDDAAKSAPAGRG